MDSGQCLSLVRHTLLNQTPESTRYTSHAAIWRIAAPMVLSNLSVPLLGLVDTAVVGHLSEAYYLGAVAIGATIFSFLYNGVNFLRMGTTGVTAQSLGANDPARLGRALLEGSVVALLIALIFLIAQGGLADLALTLMKPTAEVANEARVYFAIRIWSAPATLLSAVIVGWFLGLGNARVPLLIVLIVNLSNIVLDLAFVIGLKMTTNGVALASLIAEYAGVITAIILARRECRQRALVMAFAGLMNPGRYRQYFSVNGNLFVRTMALMVTLFFVTAQSARFGTVVLAANAILLNLQYLVSYALDALAHSAEALVGRAYGERDRKALAILVRRIFIWAVGIAIGISVIFAIGGMPLVRLLTSLPEVIKTAEQYLIWLILSPLLSVWSFVYDGIFVGATRAREMRDVMVVAALAVFLPVWALTQAWGNHGLWFAFSVFMVARAVGMHLYYKRSIVNQL